MRPPPPWLTDTSLPPRLSLHLNSVARARFPYDQERGLLALQHSLRTLDAGAVEHAVAPELAPIGGASVRSSLVVSSTIKLVAMIAAVGLAALGLWHEGRVQQISRASGVQSVHAVASSAPVTTGAMPQPASMIAAVEASPQLERATFWPVQPATAKLPSSRLVQTAELSRARREIAQLEQIKRTMPSDPRVALRLAHHSAREFPQGLLREEREALIVLALWQLGEVASARAGAERFLSSYPRSSFRPRIQRCMLP